MRKQKVMEKQNKVKNQKEIEEQKDMWKQKIFRYRQIVCAVALIFTFTFIITAEFYNMYISPNDETVEALSKYGSTGDEVRSIQKKLKELGYYTGSVDGIYGSGTKNAVIKFQKNCGITADGIAGAKTLKYLGLGSSSSSSYGGYSSADYNLLARLISAEARGETYTGQVAVGAVVLNRVAHASFPDSISGVIYQSGAFDCVRDSNWYSTVTDSAKRAAKDALNGWDPSGGAIYYFNPATATSSWIWSRPQITKIGNHIFCK